MIRMVRHARSRLFCRARAPRIIAGIALLSFASPVRGQTSPAQAPPSAKTGKSAIVGVVVDSLHGRYLSDADVVIDGAKVTLHTDSLGKFRIDSLSPGTYQVGVFHALLDSLDLTLLTKPFHIGPDSASIVVLAVPSAATMIRRECPDRPAPPGSSAVVGHVNDPETLRAVAGAEVSLAWTEIKVGKEFGIRRTAHVVRDTTDSIGAFRICGLPASLSASIQARRGAAVTAEIPIEVGDRPPQFVARSLSLSVDSGAKIGNAAVSGVVVLEGSATGAGTRIELPGTNNIAMTNEKGEFTMKNLPSGSSVLLARHLGYAAETVPVELSSRQEQHVTMKLSKFVAVMDPVLVIARRTAALDKVGFSQRVKSGMGYYMGPERLQRMHPIFVTDILRQVPGLRVSYGPRGETISSSRGVGSGCVQYWVDDMPWMSVEPGDLNQFVAGGEVVAVEVYQDTGTPARYIRAGGSCTTIVLWTRFKIRS